MTSKHGKSDSTSGHHPSSLAEAIVHTINPFAAVGANAKEALALSEDGVPTKSHSHSSKQTAADEEKADSDNDSNASKSSRHRSRGTLRSLSPFRFHSSRRSSSRTRLRVSGNVDDGEDDANAEHQPAEKSGKKDWEWRGYWRRRSRRDSDDTVTGVSSKGGAGSSRTDRDEPDADEHETERARICPRNTAFNSNPALDDLEDTEEDGDYVRIPPRPPPKEGGEHSSSSATTETEKSDPAPEESEDEEESDIDEELLDNTLFNAGCLDLHNDWRDAHEYGEHHKWEGYDEDGIARPELKKDSMFCDEVESMVPYADPNHIGDVPIPDEADHLLNAPNLVLSPSQLRLDPCGTSALRTPSLPTAPVGNTAATGGSIASVESTPPNAFDAALLKATPNQPPSAKSTDSSGHTSSSAVAAAAAAASGGTALDARSVPTRDGSVGSFMGGQLGEGDRALRASRPVFERNRCTITLLHGQYEEKLAQARRPKRYVVASDGSAEALYAIEWTIGTVMRDGDETMIVSVMETDTKLDAVDHVFEDKQTRMSHQKIRQDMTLVLARQATNLLQRTRLGVKVVCQALHATNSRRMLIDLTDYFSPTLLIVGSRGMGSIKGILLGSTSHYLLQKASVPVMVARRRLRLPALPRGKADVVQSVRRRHLRLDEASIEKETPPTPEDDAAKAEEQQSGGTPAAAAAVDGSKKDVAEGEAGAAASALEGGKDEDLTVVPSGSSVEGSSGSLTTSNGSQGSGSATSEEGHAVGAGTGTGGVKEDDDDDNGRGRSRGRARSPVEG
ncbi:unnamed protein product [Tilletia controversa]|uniref:UspA domain-containing protein n=1 Tax=Tilletia controversa TaxID=13291 RepID=A0A8X7MTC2_9BASI|nr:hypothetical protein CF328_g166 [Tilletia controversa]KAE8247938.1 hypothetical protein A4X06_0g4077 [Tilletia controversa]CAD6940570.1 unnamed protein product [Tilletia controversa]